MPYLRALPIEGEFIPPMQMSLFWKLDLPGSYIVANYAGTTMPRLPALPIAGEFIPPIADVAVLETQMSDWYFVIEILACSWSFSKTKRPNLLASPFRLSSQQN